MHGISERPSAIGSIPNKPATYSTPRVGHTIKATPIANATFSISKTQSAIYSNPGRPSVFHSTADTAIAGNSIAKLASLSTTYPSQPPAVYNIFTMTAGYL